MEMEVIMKFLKFSMILSFIGALIFTLMWLIWVSLDKQFKETTLMTISIILWGVSILSFLGYQSIKTKSLEKQLKDLKDKEL
jgi:glucan phosphoethanolaminetransferase (alkaline phosphatase superfamily)